MPVNPILIQQDPALKRKYELAQSLAGQSLSSAPVQSPFEALSRVGQAYFAKKGIDSAESEMKSRNDAARKTLADAISPKKVQTPFVDEAGESFGIGTPPGLVASEQDVPKSYQEMAAILSGNKDTAPFALQIQLSDAEQKAKSQSDIQQTLLKHQLERTGKKEELQTWLQLAQQLNGGKLQPGQSLKVSPRGPEFSFDPAAAESADIARRRLEWETGGGIPGGRSVLPPKAQTEADTARIKQLREGSAARLDSIQKAASFLEKLENNQMSSGAGRAALRFVPGVYTEQGRLDELFNAFAETAARQALKAAGETRQTDADVKGMKEAMFGIGRDEKVNAPLLQSYIQQQLKDENEYRQLQGLPPIEVPSSPDARTPSLLPKGLTATDVEAARKSQSEGDFRYLWKRR